jgi:hypothetical protein
VKQNQNYWVFKSNHTYFNKQHSKISNKKLSLRKKKGKLAMQRYLQIKVERTKKKKNIDLLSTIRYKDLPSDMAIEIPAHQIK